jgi:hypothetical protein
MDRASGNDARADPSSLARRLWRAFACSLQAKDDGSWTRGGYHLRNGNISNDHHDREPPSSRRDAFAADTLVDIGYAIVHAGGTETNDDVVFAEEGDMILLGARSLEGVNLRVDARSKQLVDAGPVVAAVA